MHDGNQSTNSLLPSFSQSRVHRRFSSDFANGDSLLNPSNTNESLHSGLSLAGTNMVSSTLLPHSHSSRPRSMTSMGMGDDLFFGDLYENEPFESAQESLFQTSHAGSLSIDPIETFGSPYGLRSSVDAPLHSSSMKMSIPYQYDSSQNLDYPADGLDPIYIGRSMSDVNSSSFESFDFNNSTMFKFSNATSSHPSLMKRNSTSKAYPSSTLHISDSL